MLTITTEKPAAKAHVLRKLIALTLLFALILLSIFVIRLFPQKESEFIDSVAGQIEQEMAENQIVLSKKGGRRTVAEFKEPILLTHGKESRLIVYTAELSETVSLADEGWGGFKWNSTYQEAKYYGLAEYTVDLSQLSEEDFIVNNELKILTVRIPYAILSPINILNDKTQFYDPEKGWAGPKGVKLTAEELNKVMIEIEEKMKAQLIDKNIIAKANEAAKTVVAELLTATVQAVDPEFTVVVVH
jgi:hypothetical protein